MANEPSLEAMRKNSRHAAIGTALGAAIVLGAIAFSVGSLGNLNGQIANLNGQIAGKKLELTKADDELKAKREELERVQSWGDLFRVCAIGGQIAVAQDKAEAQSAYEELVEIKGSIQKLANAPDADDRSRAAEQVVEIIEDLRPLVVEGWSSEEAWVETPLRLKIFDLGNNAKLVVGNAPSTIIEFKDELARVLYDQAIAVVARLHYAPASQWNEQPTTSDRAEFWRLYWGDLVFIESTDFAGAMFHTREALESAGGEKPASLKEEIMELAAAYKLAEGRFPRLPNDLLPP